MTAPAAAHRHAAELQRLRAAFERLARVECAPRSPLWAEVCLAVAADEPTLALAMRAPAAQRRPSLLLAAIHDLLLAGTEHPLATHVPTVAGERAPRGRPGELALDFCAAHREQIEDLLVTRGTQTNEVNRVAALLPALAHATPPGARLRLVELGASAGLNLLADRYEVRYRGSGSTAIRSTCEIRARRAGCWPAPGPTRPTASPGCAPRSLSRDSTRRPSCAATRSRCSVTSRGLKPASIR